MRGIVNCAKLPSRRAFWAGIALVLWLGCGPASAQFLYTTNGGGITITGYDGPGGWVTVPDMIDGLPVTSIANAAFANQTNITVP